MAGLLQFCNQFSPLDEEATADLFENLKTKTYQKGEYLLTSGKTCKNLFFINEGLAKTFYIKNDKEFVTRFFSENVLFTDFDSYLTQTPTKFTIIALEPTTVTMISQSQMEELCKKHHSMETFFRKLVSIATVKMIKRISELLEENATVRYNQFVKENNLLLQRISLGDIAKYIGITQQSLSRIRNQI